MSLKHNCINMSCVCWALYCITDITGHMCQCGYTVYTYPLNYPIRHVASTLLQCWDSVGERRPTLVRYRFYIRLLSVYCTISHCLQTHNNFDCKKFLTCFNRFVNTSQKVGYIKQGDDLKSVYTEQHTTAALCSVYIPYQPFETAPCMNNEK